jgi:hypothetical protein
MLFDIGLETFISLGATALVAASFVLFPVHPDDDDTWVTLYLHIHRWHLLMRFRNR